MKLLPLERLWTGDGRGQSDAVTHKQLKRTDNVALYSVTNKNGVIIGHEVFTIKRRLKGQPLPGGLFELEDREVYPSANSFGKSAWAPSGSNVAAAEKIYNHLVNGDVEVEDEAEETTVDVTPKEPGRRGRAKGERPHLNVPVAEFTVKELAESNSVEYPIAFTFIKEAIAAGTVQFVREERRNAKGKPSNIYAGVAPGRIRA